MWKKDIIYVGTKEIAEVSPTGTSITMTDHLGSPRFTWDGVTTPIQQKFLPFGEQLTPPGVAAGISKGFTNHEQTDASGLIYMQARFYLPMWGRFASPDPARDQHFEETQSWNIYSYVQNSPVMTIDPNGEAGLLAWARDKYEQAKSQVVAGVQNTASFSRGMTDAYVNAVGLGIPSAFGGSSDGSVAYASGRAVGDGAAMLQGAAEAEIGKDGAGLALVAGPASSGVMAVASALTIHGVGTIIAAAMDGGSNASSPKQMQKEVERGQAPRDVDHVHDTHTGKEEPHIKYKDGTSSTKSGGVHDKKGGTPNPPKKTREWIKEHGWEPPPKKQ